MKTKEKQVLILLLVSIGVLFNACCPMNPTLNTVITAHGNTDWHIDTAEEFLTGSDMDGNATASNHCPDTWTKTHMHEGLSNTNGYYYDVDEIMTGEDIDIINGIDRAMLFFYAGHGHPTYFNTLGNLAYLTNMKLGNCEGVNRGILRYYWQCSCEVFAHGPKTCPGETWSYACPEDFDGSADSDAMRNVFERWGAILSPELRMACGSSTAAYCHQTETNKIWDYYNNQGYEVADAFIFGLHRYDWNTPLCITTGKWQASSTPLFDQTFTNLPNPSGPFLHIQYLSEFDINVPMRIIDLPEMLPIFYMIPLPLPEMYRSYEVIEEEEWIISKTKLKERGIPLFRVNKNSGSIYAFGERNFDEESQVLKENEYMRLADKFLTDQGWSEKSVKKPIGQKMMIESAPGDGYVDEKAKVVQKNVMIVYNRQIIIEGDTVNTVGEGGKIIVQLNNDGSVYNASKVWREIKGIKKTTKAKKYDQAYKEAFEQVEARNEYELDSWTWGYEEYAGNVTQTELKAVYLFNFAPIDKENTVEYPPMVIKISAHLE